MKITPEETGRLLDRTTDGRSLSFRVDSPQKWHDSRRQTDRIMRYYGECRACGRRTYAFDDGENDPRGVLGDHAADPLVFHEHLPDDEAREVLKTNMPDVPACFGCMNDYDQYQYLMHIALRRARKLGADI